MLARAIALRKPIGLLLSVGPDQQFDSTTDSTESTDMKKTRLKTSFLSVLSVLSVVAFYSAFCRTGSTIRFNHGEHGYEKNEAEDKFFVRALRVIRGRFLFCFLSDRICSSI